MSDTSEIIKVDSKTMLDLGEAVNELADFLQWLGGNDAEAFDRLKRICLRIARLMMAITVSNDPDFAPVADAIEHIEDLQNEALAKATTIEEIQAIRAQNAAGWKMFNEKIEKLFKLHAESQKKEPQQ